MKTKHIHKHNKKNKVTTKKKTKKKIINTWYLVAYGHVGFTYPPSIHFATAPLSHPYSIGPYGSAAEAYAATFGVQRAYDGRLAWSVTSITQVSGKTVRYSMVNWSGPTADLRIDRASAPVYLYDAQS
jgi:hypothetical protein